MKLAFSSACLSLLWFLALPSLAAGGRTDYDLDNNGLIEINDLADLNEIRNNLDGKKLYASSTGCPAAGCNGFELTTDLNLDTNSDGKFDVNDSYWNAGLGWVAIGADFAAPFTAIFEGNGHIIRNLVINRPSSNYQGLFGAVQNATLRNLGMSGRLMSITANSQVGGLAGATAKGTLVSCFASGTIISGSGYAGGLVGQMDGGTITGSFTAGSVQSPDDYVGGLVGYATGTISSVFSSTSVSGAYAGGILGYGNGTTLTAAYAVGKVSGMDSYHGGLIGLWGDVSASYWANDATGQTEDGVGVSGTSYAATLAQLKCPTTTDNVGCLTGATLYAGWGALKDAKGNAYWSFGTNTQLPGLMFNGVVYRDSDADGYLDADDAWPTNPAAGVDIDGDGAIDKWAANCDTACQAASGLVLDQFPNSAAATLDLDLDGKPDAWNASCNTACQTASGLVLDTKLNDADNDGIVDSTDTDLNNDGIIDADANHNGLVEVSSWAQFDAMRNNLSGSGRKLTTNGTIDSSGCGAIIVNGVLQRGCNGYELTQDLDFDTNVDGKLDASDTYWNTGLGWVGIGTSSNGFQAVFDGNGHVIRNLMINRPTTSNHGLFSYLNSAVIRNLGLTGKLMSITAQSNVGAIAGQSRKSNVINCFSTGAIISTYASSSYAGGLVGNMENGSIIGSFSAGSVQAKSSYVGGLVGRATSITLESVFSSASLSGNYVGGLFGYASDTTIKGAYSVGKVITNSFGGGLSGNGGTFTASYWASDVSGQSSDRGAGSKAATVVQLKCPTAADNTSCLTGTNLYAGWAALKDPKGAAYWDFGSNAQLPGLVLNGVLYRDSDGDSYVDADDKWPTNPAASLDTDNDGAPDRWAPGCDGACQASSGLVLDQFPTNSAASVDLDLDGKPDAWNASCNTACQTASGLVLDTKLNDADNDGIVDTIDTDINNDGITDVDLNHNGLIDISTMAQLDAVRNNLSGTGRQLTAGGTIDSSGCGVTVINGTLQRACIGYELTKDLDFDTNTDGKLDVNDSFWNGGLGWAAIGSSTATPFVAIFEGNGHVIRNLMVNRPTENLQGLFGFALGATLRNLGLKGNLMSITALGNVGGLVGATQNSTLINCFATGAIVSVSTTDAYAGGLVGSMSGGSITGSFTAGSVQGVEDYVGGLVGYASGSISSVFSSANVSGTSYVGGITGYGNSTNITAAYVTGKISGANSYVGGLGGLWGNFSKSYWAFDTAGQSSAGTGISGISASLAQLKCPTSADNVICAPGISLYVGWGALKDAKGNAYWDFGTNAQVPGLVLNGVVYRDNDADGYLDSDDILPENPAVGLDVDGDGVADRWTAGCDRNCQFTSGVKLDQFPTTAAASLDLDLDGKPDAWNASCNTACQTASGLVLDAKPNDADNDGIVDTVDTDINNDGVVDADANHNGLIEVSTLAQLNAIRNNLNGSGRQLTAGGSIDSSGCGVLVIVNGAFQRTCIGYELTQDLDFDTNADGKLDASDSYWNAGAGWVAIGQPSLDFSAIFDGNGHVIRNLMINRPTEGPQGLFGSAVNANLRNLGLTGKLMSITAQSNVGSLVGNTYNTTIANCFATGAIFGTSSYSQVGGLVGYLSNGSITGSFTTGNVEGAGNYVGGIAGSVYQSTLEAVFSSASVAGTQYVGGIVGSGNTITFNAAYAVGKVNASIYGGGITGDGSDLTNTYWATDATGQLEDRGNGATPATLAQLKCPTAENNATCLSGTNLYAGWGNLKDAKGATYWSFGTNTQLPGLTLNGVVYRDNDADGYLDVDDKWPANPASGLDTDDDGAPDKWAAGCDSACQAASGLVLDQFPTKSTAAVDADLDGKPDVWNSSCNTACQTASGLILDTLLNDSDNDGIANNLDSDDNNDSVKDADSDSNGLIEVATLAELDAIRNNLKGTGRQLTANGIIDSSGCPMRIVRGVLQPACFGYELTVDLNFDTNGDGKLDAGDTYWNNGLGWSPLGSDDSDNFSATFEGNNHVIRNLMINNPSATRQGLFGYALGASLRNLGITGRLTSVNGSEEVGGLAGVLTGGAISACYFNGKVSSEDDYAGGLVGRSENSTITASYSTGSVQARGDYVGGLLGYAYQTDIANTFSTASVSGDDEVGGLVGLGYQLTGNAAYATGKIVALDADDVGGLIGNEDEENLLTNSYWAIDSSSQATDGSAGAIGVTRAQLQCPTTANNTLCVTGKTLYDSWDNLKDSKGVAYWNFGDATQLPGLVLNGAVHRDGDGDGDMDADDVFPNNPAAAVDVDGDGAPDRWTENCDASCQLASGLTLDQFPNKVAAAKDTDFDGMPDLWNASCNTACQAASGLILDPKPNDTDNDGITNDIDNDDNNDGVVDADSNSNGLIDVATLEELDAIRNNLSGNGQQLTVSGTNDSSGCPLRVVNGVLEASCAGYELTVDLDFDTNKDGKLDASDSYWNGGLGWAALGIDYSTPFTAVFDGNGHVIRNLMINRPTDVYQGLFGRVVTAEIRNLGLSGASMSVIGEEYVGAVAGWAERSSIKACFSIGSIKSTYTSSIGYTGGLIGGLSNSNITASFTTGSVTSAGGSVGGLVGYVNGKSLLQAVFSTAAVTGQSYVGGLVGWGDGLIDAGYAAGLVTSTSSDAGAITGIFGASTASYWATDATGRTSDGESDSTAIGVTLAQLKCPMTADNITCVAGKTLYQGWGKLKDSKGNFYWSFGTSSQLPALVLNGVAVRDTDADGVFDVDDLDDDNDGVLDASDQLPLNPAASVDGDGDESPTSWNASCDATCQANSGLKLDAFPTNKAASVDTDGDGSPNTWSPSCDANCQAASGLKLDAFPTNKAASLDSDGDSRPDAWNASCNLSCQTASGLTLDALLNDKDNDGVPDASDTDNSKDNGRPTVVAVPQDINIAATGATTLVTLVKADVTAVDLVDKQLDLEVFNGDQKLMLDTNNQVALPSGAIKLGWVAIDDAGNRSDAVEQVVNIYPQVQFTKAQDLTGEKSNAKLGISFSGAVPVYPVKLTFTWITSESTATAADVNTSVETGIDFNELAVTINNADELAKAALVIPVLEDATAEVDENLVFDIASASAGTDTPFSLPVVAANKRTVLTITEKNLAPSVVLSMVQAGKVTNIIDSNAGVVEVTSVVTDLNGKDLHSFAWETAGLPVSGLDKTTYSFDPLKMANGNYTLSVTITDNGVPPLSSEKVSLKFEVKGQTGSSSSANSSSSSSSSSSSAIPTQSGGSGGGGGGGGGSIDFILLFVLCGLGISVRWHLKSI
jgi:hypothetical protein